MNTHQAANARIPQNFLLVWLDGSIDRINNDDCYNSVLKLRQVVNSVNTFTNADKCLDFITDIKEEKVFIIASEAFSQIIIPVVHEISQVSSVYIFSGKKDQHEQWTNKSRKVKGIFTEITSICDALKYAAQECDQNSISISFVKTSDEVSNKNLNELDQSFMYTQILKEILFTFDFQQDYINEFSIYYHEQFDCNSAELKDVEKFRKEYHQHQPIWWYTSQGFLYSMLNRALRLMEVDLIIKMGFFVWDLHQQIAALHAEQYTKHHHSDSFTVYRGQGLSRTDFDQLMNTQGGLMSFNNFLSTSLDRVVSLAFAESNRFNPDLIGVLFEITINPTVSATCFASICDVSAHPTEEEILFSMHSIFRIGKMTQLDEDNRLWQVDLILTSDNDPQLHALTECMRKETAGTTAWQRLGQLMLKLGHFDKAEKLYEMVLQQTTNEDEKAILFHHLGFVKYQQEKCGEAFGFYEKSIEISQKHFPPNDPRLAASYNNIGTVYDSMGEYSKALSYYEKALGIMQKTLPPNHLDFAKSYNNIGQVYYEMGEYRKVLSYFQKALEIFQKTLPPNHPSLATSYNNIGQVYCNMSEYSKALPYYQKAFEISRKTLPPNHLDLAVSYDRMGKIFNEMGECQKALLSYQKALEIFRQNLSENHPHLANTYQGIGCVYINMGDYSKALSYYEKDLKIKEKTLPPNHPHLSSSYNNIGVAYYNMYNYSKALSYYEKALEMETKNLPPNDPTLGKSYSNIGCTYLSIHDYSKALSYFEKDLEIQQKAFFPNQLDLANSYSNIGQVYCAMGDYMKALSFLKRSLDIFQRLLPPNHPDLQEVRMLIKLVNTKI